MPLIYSSVLLTQTDNNINVNELSLGRPTPLNHEKCCFSWANSFMSDDGNDKGNLEAAGFFLKYQFKGNDLIRQVTAKLKRQLKRKMVDFKDKVLQLPVLKLNSFYAPL